MVLGRAQFVLPTARAQPRRPSSIDDPHLDVIDRQPDQARLALAVHAAQRRHREISDSPSRSTNRPTEALSDPGDGGSNPPAAYGDRVHLRRGARYAPGTPDAARAAASSVRAVMPSLGNRRYRWVATVRWER